jgi:cytosine/adenosine deaminase-related metal-dependent hydrolase
VRKVLSADWVLPVEGDPIENGAVALEDGRIAAVGTAAELGEGDRFDGAAILPGLVNAHTHLEYAVYAGFGDGLGFARWISLHVERKARIGWDEFVAIARLGAAESLASGVTTIGDCSYSGATAVACAELGLRGTVYLEVFGSDPDAIRAQFHEKRDRAAPFVSQRVRIGVSPHAPFTVSLAGYQACAELGVPVATHLAESPDEHDYVTGRGGAWAGYSHLLVEPPGTTGIRLLAANGLFGPDVVAAHCVTVDAEEIGLLAHHRVGVAHCPRSNAALGCGVAPLAELRAAGVAVGLGTDSPASAPSLDFFEELRSAALFARARDHDPTALSGTEALELATLGSARALGLDGEIGSLVPGKRADLTVVSLAQTPYVPWEDPATAVVFGGSPRCVIATLVDGEERYRKGVFQWHELRNAAASARSRMLARSGRAVEAEEAEEAPAAEVGA